MRFILFLFLLLSVGLATLQFWSWGIQPEVDVHLATNNAYDDTVPGPIQPIPEHHALDENLIALGRRLFNEKGLSPDHSTACANCHQPDHGGSDGLPVSVGIRDALGTINAPTVYNSSYNFRQFWDGRTDTLEDQVDGPLTHPNEMGSSWEHALTFLFTTATYQADFLRLFKDGLTADNVRHAIATYERSLTTPHSRFDRYLRGDKNAITDDERSGYITFQTLGCAACHQGASVGGNMFQKIGLFGNYFADRGDITDSDSGRYNVTGNELDRHVFKVPSLRLAIYTAPYFHDGSVPDLRTAIQLMAKYQLGREISENDIHLLIAFIGSLAPPLEALPR